MLENDWKPCNAQAEFLEEFPRGFLANLDAGQRLLLMELAAGIAERAYRRGFQHGEYAADNGAATVETHKWRFGASLGEAPSPFRDGWKTTSLKRLDMECGHWFEHAFDQGLGEVLGYFEERN